MENTLTVVNGLGANIQQLYYREGGQVYGLETALAAGERGTLKAAAIKGPEVYGQGLRRLRSRPRSSSG
jgi:hypothetical protein